MVIRIRKDFNNGLSEIVKNVLMEIYALKFCLKSVSFTKKYHVFAPTRPVDNVAIATKGLQDRNINILAGTTVKNKDKLIQFPLIIRNILNYLQLTVINKFVYKHVVCCFAFNNWDS